MEKLKIVFFDTEKQKFEIKLISHELNEIYDLLNCHCFDIVKRKIGESEIDIFCDDEFLFSEKLPSAINEYGQISLLGNLIFASCDNSTGETISLNEKQIEDIFLNRGIGEFANGDKFLLISLKENY